MEAWENKQKKLIMKWTIWMTQNWMRQMDSKTMSSITRFLNFSIQIINESIFKNHGDHGIFLRRKPQILTSNYYNFFFEEVREKEKGT